MVGQASHGAELGGAEAALKVLGLKKDKNFRKSLPRAAALLLVSKISSMRGLAHKAYCLYTTLRLTFFLIFSNFSC